MILFVCLWSSFALTYFVSTLVLNMMDYKFYHSTTYDEMKNLGVIYMVVAPFYVTIYTSLDCLILYTMLR